MKIYNTLERRKEEFKSIKFKKVSMYSCGPTVYNYAHIGNLRSYINVDILKRWLEYSGYKVNQVMNITDVGHLTSDSDTGTDKVEEEAKKEGKSAWDIAKAYTTSFFDDTSRLNIEKANTIAPATEYIKEQIKFVSELEKKGYTYQISDGIYFDTSKLKTYGRLSNVKAEKLRAGARVKIVKGKRNVTDFALWKFSPKDEKRQMEWDSPWGKGFPGWHLECSVISKKFLGDVFDIHTGGIDHIPIHHTNEIAQSEALTGKIPANFWVHGEFLLVEGQKMSKSLGNVYTLDEMVQKFGVEPLAFRMLCLTSHYRDSLNFTHSSIIDAQNTLNNLRHFVLKIKLISDQNVAVAKHNRFEKMLERAKKNFAGAMDDDLALPKAMASLFDFIKEFHRERDYSAKDAKAIYDFLMDIDRVLGLDLASVQVDVVPGKVQGMAVLREDARKSGEYEKADKLREQIEKAGYVIEDSEDGPLLRKK